MSSNNNYYLTKEAKADGYIVKSVKVTHHGLDYSKVEVHWQNGEIFEVETPHGLAAAIVHLLKGGK